MKNAFPALTAAALALAFAFPAHADRETGQIQEIIVKIHTKDGVKYFRVGKDTKLVDIRPGKTVDFDYADDDVLESISESSPATGNGAESGPARTEKGK